MILNPLCPNYTFLFSYNSSSEMQGVLLPNTLMSSWNSQIYLQSVAMFSPMVWKNREILWCCLSIYAETWPSSVSTTPCWKPRAPSFADPACNEQIILWLLVNVVWYDVKNCKLKSQVCFIFYYVVPYLFMLSFYDIYSSMSMRLLNLLWQANISHH